MRLEAKLNKIKSGSYRSGDFILADAKDSDMGSGVTGTGFMQDGSGYRRRSRQDFLNQIENIIEQDVVDIMLLSASNLEILAGRGVFKNTGVKPAIRANDATDCWGGVRHGRYTSYGSRPFRSASLPRVMHGGTDPNPGAKITGTDLGLYSITFINDLEADLASLQAFADFREDAARNGFHYFYEVFNPNIDCGLDKKQIGEFLNDCVLRSLAGVLKADRPEFLKIPFNGPTAMEELAGFDSEIVVGVLGGAAGTTRDSFELLEQSERYGARVALFGRKINQAESQRDFITLMRAIADGNISAKEAVKAYHSKLNELGIKPTRTIEDDNNITEGVLLKGAK
jgi:hypothetical protein